MIRDGSRIRRPGTPRKLRRRGGSLDQNLCQAGYLEDSDPPGTRSPSPHGVGVSAERLPHG